MRPANSGRATVESIMLNRPADIEGQIRALKSADLEALKRRWRAVFRKAFPAHLPRPLVVNLLAFQLQAAVFGDLAPEELRFLAGSEPGKVIARYDPEKSRHQPGTIYVREHAGVLHRAVKTIRGFEWKGEEFLSLSAVAFAITGTKWNGLRFFGVSSPEQKRCG
jgi:hypothetical protein